MGKRIFVGFHEEPNFTEKGSEEMGRTIRFFARRFYTEAETEEVGGRIFYHLQR
jgi:hypothetical protein